MTIYPGYEAHVEGMTEVANEARIERNELAWVNHQIDQAIQTVEFHQNEMQVAERLLAALRFEAEWRTEQVAEAA